jgi:hypothetical protein
MAKFRRIRSPRSETKRMHPSAFFIAARFDGERAIILSQRKSNISRAEMRSRDLSIYDWNAGRPGQIPTEFDFTNSTQICKIFLQIHMCKNFYKYV